MCVNVWEIQLIFVAVLTICFAFRLVACVISCNDRDGKHCIKKEVVCGIISGLLISLRRVCNRAWVWQFMKKCSCFHATDFCLFVCMVLKYPLLKSIARARLCKMHDEFSGSSSSDLFTEENDLIFYNLLSSICHRTATLI